MTICDQVIVVAGVSLSQGPDQAFRFEATTLRPAKDLPTHPGGWDSGKNVRRFTHSRITLGDGTVVLIWGGEGYELRDGKFERTWDLDCTDQHLVPFGKDGFFFLRKRVLHQVRRGSSPRVVCADADDILGVWAGPQGSVLIHQGYRNRRKVVSRLWFPEDDSFHLLKARPDLSDNSGGVFGSLHWSEKTQHLYIFHDDYLLTIPGEVLLKRRHYRPRPISGGR